MLLDVITRVSADTGYHIVQKRQALLNLLNNAAREMYDSLEANDIYREVTCLVPRNKLVSLPSIIGDLRGVREHTIDYPFPLESMSAPRYVDDRWDYRVRNWREINQSPVHTYLSAVGALNITFVPSLDDPVTLLISGQTANADRAEETILLDGTPKITGQAFGPTIYSISCVQERAFNITIRDSNAVEVAILYNTQSETRYVIVDVSQVFWQKDTTDDETLVDICYKMPLWKLTKDSDVFPAGSAYDNAWYHLCMHKYFSPMQNRRDDANNERALYAAALTETKGGREQNLVKKLSFGQNKFYDLYHRNYYDTAFTYPFGNSWCP